MYYKKFLILVIFFIYSCQPLELMSPIQLDTSLLQKISINSKEIIIQKKYNPVFSNENIEDQLIIRPIVMIESWIDSNIKAFGNQNNFVITIYDASITKKEIKNTEAKKYEEKTLFYYEILFLVEYELFDDNNYLLANTTVETSRSTTSQKYISLNEKEIIINDLLNKAVKDFVNESIVMTKLYMNEYLKY